MLGSPFACLLGLTAPAAATTAMARRGLDSVYDNEPWKKPTTLVNSVVLEGLLLGTAAAAAAGNSSLFIT